MDDIFYNQNPEDFRVDLNRSDLFNNYINTVISQFPDSKLQNFTKIQAQNQQSNQYSISLRKQQQNSNVNTKNKYINKIKQMIKQNKVVHPPSVDISANYKNSNESQMIGQNSQKKSRNRLSAKMSRQRKKIYIQLLENKIQQVSNELSKKKQELESTKNYMQKLILQNQAMSGFAIGKQQVTKGLQKIIQKNPNPNVNEINQLLQKLKSNGETGRNRSNTIKQYFNQIVNVSFPALHRYMMWTASEKKHLFEENKSQNQTQEWFKQLQQKLGLSQEQKLEIKLRRQQLQEQKNTLIGIINNLHKERVVIQQKSEQVEQEINEIRKIFSPIQFAKFILFIEKNKYRKELNIWEKQSQMTLNKNVKFQEDKVIKKRKL